MKPVYHHRKTYVIARSASRRDEAESNLVCSGRAPPLTRSQTGIARSQTIFGCACQTPRKGGSCTSAHRSCAPALARRRMAALSSLDEALIGVRAEKLDQLCSRDDLNEISKALTRWPEVSPFLGLTRADEEDVRTKHDRAVSGVMRERVDVLRRWQENQKERATYRWVLY